MGKGAQREVYPPGRIQASLEKKRHEVTVSEFLKDRGVS